MARVSGRSVVRTLYGESPLKLVASRSGDAAWVFAGTFGGGLVDGDSVALEIDVARGATCLVTTQASTKAYRSPRGVRSDVEARVASDALLAWLPDPLVCFEGARYAQRTHVELESDASVALLDLLGAGRVARGERWSFAHHRSELVVPGVVHEALELDPRDGSISERMSRFDVIGTLLLAGPRLAAARDRVKEEIARARLAPGEPLVESASVRGDALVVRLAATDVERAMRRVRSHLREAFAILGGDPFARKW